MHGELQIVGRRAARAAAQHVGADVSGDDCQPRVRNDAHLPNRGNAFQGTGKCLLCRILGLVAIIEGDACKTAATAGHARAYRLPKAAESPAWHRSTSTRSRSRSTSSQRVVSSSWRSANVLVLPLHHASRKEVGHIMSRPHGRLKVPQPTIARKGCGAVSINKVDYSRNQGAETWV